MALHNGRARVVPPWARVVPPSFHPPTPPSPTPSARSCRFQQWPPFTASHILLYHTIRGPKYNKSYLSSSGNSFLTPPPPHLHLLHIQENFQRAAGGVVRTSLWHQNAGINRRSSTCWVHNYSHRGQGDTGGGRRGRGEGQTGGGGGG